MGKGVDFRKYTRREAGAELAAIERHLGGLNENTAAFCLECLAKHTLHLTKLCDEGKQFFPEDVAFWSELKDFAEEILDKGEEQQVTFEDCQKWMTRARDFRKSLQERYFGNMGKCECVTGLERCCKHTRAGKAA